MMEVCIILPAYNEENTIAETISDFHKELPEASIWVINNRSNDATEAIAKKTIEDLACKGGVMNELRAGKGNALRYAFLNINSDIYIISDADSTYPASQIGELIKPIISGEADMVLGDRQSGGQYLNENKRAFHNFGNNLVRRLVNKLFSANLVDILTGYRAFNNLFVKSYPILVSGFEIETDMTIHALDKRFRIIEVPINYRDRPKGSFSKLNTIKDGLRVLGIIVRIFRYYRPFIFFGSLALVGAIFTLIAGTVVIKEFINTGYITHIPLAILAASLGITSIIFSAIALILDAISHQDKRNFERDLLSKKFNH
jgi:glycosyltransferase involved in cell wall biosynthesis